VFVAVALNLLPYLSSDYPDEDKSNFYKMYTEWNSIKDELVDLMLNDLCRIDSELTSSEFVSRATTFP
jgi:hypothetical protein